MRTSSIETRISLANPTSIIPISRAEKIVSTLQVPPFSLERQIILYRTLHRKGNTALSVGSWQCWGLQARGVQRQLTESLPSFHLYVDSADRAQVTRFTLSGGKCLNWIGHPIIPLSDCQPCCKPLVFIYLRWRYACWAWQTWVWVNGFFREDSLLYFGQIIRGDYHTTLRLPSSDEMLGGALGR